MKKSILGFSAALVIGLYTTFVMQFLWNLFVAPTFHLGQISYWMMYGIQLLVAFVFENWGKDRSNEQQMKKLFTIASACVPAEARGELNDALVEVDESIWSRVKWMAIHQVINNTVTLVIGIIIGILAS